MPTCPAADQPSTQCHAPREVAALDVPGRIELAGVVGSVAYGLNTASSDIDTLGVYQAPAEQVLGLDGHRTVERSVVSHEPDATYHEIGKFLRLALAANPTITELLWLPHHPICTTAGRQLLELRDAVLSAPKVRAAYLGYATQQSRRLTARRHNGQVGFDAGGAKRIKKHGRHCLRLLIAGEELLTTGHLTVNVSEHRDRIFDAGELAVADPERFTTLFEQTRDRIEAAPSVLPDRPDQDHVNRTLINIRRQQLT